MDQCVVCNTHINMHCYWEPYSHTVPKQWYYASWMLAKGFHYTDPRYPQKIVITAHTLPPTAFEHWHKQRNNAKYTWLKVMITTTLLHVEGNTYTTLHSVPFLSLSFHFRRFLRTMGLAHWRTPCSHVSHSFLNLPRRTSSKCWRMTERFCDMLQEWWAKISTQQ